MSLKFELTFVLIFGAVASWRADEVKLRELHVPVSVDPVTCPGEDNVVQ